MYALLPGEFGVWIVGLLCLECGGSYPYDSDSTSDRNQLSS